MSDAPPTAAADTLVRRGDGPIHSTAKRFTLDETVFFDATGEEEMVYVHQLDDKSLHIKSAWVKDNTRRSRLASRMVQHEDKVLVISKGILLLNIVVNDNELDCLIWNQINAIISKVLPDHFSDGGSLKSASMWRSYRATITRITREKSLAKLSMVLQAMANEIPDIREHADKLIRKIYERVKNTTAGTRQEKEANKLSLKQKPNKIFS